MSQKFHKTKYPGVFYRESAKKLAGGTVDRIYYASLTDILGAQHWKSLGRHSEGMRPQIAAQKRIALQEEASRTMPTPARRAYTIGEAVEAYRVHAEREGKHVAAPHAQYELHCRKYVHNTPIDRFLPEKAEALKNRLLEVGLSPQSVVHALTFLRRAVNFAVARKMASSNPFAVQRGGVFRLPRVDNQRERWFTPAEAKLLLEALREKSESLYQMSFLALNTGLRAPEVFRLRRSDLDVHGRCLHVWGKGMVRQTVSLSEDVLDMLISIPSHHSGLLFPDRNGKMRECTPATFHRVVEEVGLQAPKDSPNRVTFHTWRHTFASWMAMSGKVSLHELMQLMRHKNITMTLRYAHLIPTAVQKKVIHIDEILKSQD